MFKKAERKRASLRLAFTGPSGSGKTMSALRMASGMAKELGCRIAVLDTEKGSSNLYAHVTDFDVLEFNPPFPPEKYVAGLRLAEKEGYGIVVIDSISHEWQGEGGCLAMVDKIVQASSSKNSYAAWNTVTPKHQAFIDAIIQSGCHVIATIRSKVAYELVKNEKTGKTSPVKVGMAPITREGMDYEFTTVLDLSIEAHLATVSKDRTGLFDKADGIPVLITEGTGKLVLDWLNEGTNGPDS